MTVRSVTYNEANTVIDPTAGTFRFAGTVSTSGGSPHQNFATIWISYEDNNGDTKTIDVGRVPAAGNFTPNSTNNYDFNITSGPVFDALKAIPPNATVTIGNSRTGDTADETALCFMQGTLIATPFGDVKVEELKAGDLVLLVDGSTAPVRWVGHQTVSLRFVDPARAVPVLIKAGALGNGLPVRDLRVSPAHALLVDGNLVQAGALVNGSSILRDEAAPQVFTYHHVELAQHALLVAEGAPAESFIDSVEEVPFHNAAEREGFAPVEPMDLPRARSHRQVPAVTRARLAAVAAEIAGEKVAAAA